MNDPYHLPVEPMPEESWRSQALCAQIDAEIFFPDKGGSSKSAKRICSMCPVRLECLQEARDAGERFGVWGGLSERERRALERPRSPENHPILLPPRKLPAGLSHGTRAAYNTGCKCKPCRAADAYYQAERHQRRGTGGAA